MGGDLPIHISLIVYCYDEYTTNIESFTDCKKQISGKLHYDDVVFMFISHISNVIFFFANYFINNDKMLREKYRYIITSLKHLNMVLYMLAILFLQHKVYLDAVHPEDIIEFCPEEGKDIKKLVEFIDDLKAYRIFETYVFYSQIISMLFYIFYCRVFKALKNMFNP